MIMEWAICITVITIDVWGIWTFTLIDTRQKIDFISKKISQESDIYKQKILLDKIKALTKKYREEQEKYAHPKKSPWSVEDRAYEPIFRFLILLFFSILWLFFVFTIDYEELNNRLAIKDGNSQIIVALFGALPAVIIWFYRDLNNYKERETAHRDVIFSEHKQLVEWATTEVKPEANNPMATQTIEINPPMIQVAGIYQLAPFLKDHHANLYQRSTLETLRAIVNAGRPKWDNWIKDYENWILGDKKEEPKKPVLTAAEQAVHAVLRENPALFYHNHFNAKDFNLAGFDGRGLVLIGCDFQEARLEFANFSKTELTGANFSMAKLIGVNFSYLITNPGKIDHRQFATQNFKSICFSGADLSYSNLQNTLFDFKLFSTYKNAIVSEPVLLIEDDKLQGIARLVIKFGAISIADERIKTHPLFKLVEGEHNLAVEELKDKGLIPTTQASLADEHKEIS